MSDLFDPKLKIYLHGEWWLKGLKHAGDTMESEVKYSHFEGIWVLPTRSKVNASVACRERSFWYPASLDECIRVGLVGPADMLGTDWRAYLEEQLSLRKFGYQIGGLRQNTFPVGDNLVEMRSLLSLAKTLELMPAKTPEEVEEQED